MSHITTQDCRPIRHFLPAGSHRAGLHPWSVDQPAHKSIHVGDTIADRSFNAESMLTAGKLDILSTIARLKSPMCRCGTASGPTDEHRRHLFSEALQANIIL